MTEDRDFIELCKSKIRIQQKWSEEFEIRQRDFEYLSDEIFKKTQIELSTTTLRRIWSNNYKNIPQVHTLNALAQFLGNESWNDFKQQNTIAGSEKSGSSKGLNKNFILVVAASIVVIAAVILISSSSGLNASSKESVMFETDDTVYHEVPATAGFKYDISSIEEDVHIELSWNPYERVLLDKNKNFYTGTYFYPDYHYSKLLIGDRAIAYRPVHVITDNWHGSLMRSDFEKRPIYLEESEFLKADRMEVNSAVLSKHNIARDDTLYTELVFSNPIFDEAIIDELVFKTRVRKVSYGSSRLCKEIRIFLKGENGFASIPISEPGCYGEMNMVFADKFVQGKFNDLSALTADLNDWQDLKVEILNFKVKITLGDQEPFEFSYGSRLGRLKAVKYMFTGLGAVDDLKITNGSQQVVYQTDFSTGEHLEPAGH